MDAGVSSEGLSSLADDGRAAHWPNLKYPEVDYQDIIYYSAPKQKAKKASLDEVDPELLRTFEKLGIPLQEQKQLANVAVDAVFDSVSVATTYKEKLKKVGRHFLLILGSRAGIP